MWPKGAHFVPFLQILTIHRFRQKNIEHWFCVLKSAKLLEKFKINIFCMRCVNLKIFRVLCASLTGYQGYVPQERKKIIFYLLDEDAPLNHVNNTIKSCPLMQLRFFPYKLFPQHVRKLKQYR